MNTFSMNDFKTFVRKEILPVAAPLARKRLKRMRLSANLSILSLIIIGFAGYYNYNEEYFVGWVGWMVFSFIAIFLFLLAGAPSRLAMSTMNTVVIPKLMQFVTGITYHGKRYDLGELALELMDDFYFFNRYRDEGIMNPYRSSNVDSHIECSRPDCSFDAYLVTMYLGRVGDRAGSGYKGLMLKIDSHIKFDGKALLVPVNRSDIMKRHMAGHGELSSVNGKTYELFGDEETVTKCFSNDMIGVLRTFHQEMEPYLDPFGIQCSFHANQMLYFCELKKDILVLDERNPKYLEPSQLKPIIEQVYSMIKLASAA